MTEPTNDSVPMRETVKTGLTLMHERFNKDHAAFLLAAAEESGLDPLVWKPNIATFTFERVKSDGGA